MMDDLDKQPVPTPKGLSCLQRLGKSISVYWKSIIVILAPLIFLPIILTNQTSAYKCLYITCIVAVYWVTECLPLPISSIIPVVAFPMLEILGSDAICMVYMKDTIFMFLGNLFIALAVEYSNLHNRIALKCIAVIGCSQKKLNFGLVFVTMFVSMFISNTAAAAMMCPIITATLETFESQGFCKMYTIQESIEDGRKGVDKIKIPTNVTKCYYLGVAYAASLGGVGTLVGTGTNIAFVGLFETRFPNAPSISFPSWMFFNVPGMLVNTIITWAFLQWFYLGFGRPNSKQAKEVQISEDGEEIAEEVIKKKYKELGPMSFHEICVAFLFIFVIVLWFTRDPGFMPGWSDWIEKTKPKDATAAILISILLFMIPQNVSFFKYIHNPKKDPLPSVCASSLLTWKYVNPKIPWGLVFLLGGGFAIAEGGKASGMSEMLGQSLIGLENLPTLAILFFVCLASTAITNFTANVAVSNIVLPVLSELSVAIKIHPLYLMIPATISCSMAFLLPGGTPPNAIAAGLANISTKDMAIAGVLPTLLTIFTTWLLFPTWGSVIFPGLTTFPEWAQPQLNRTLTESIAMF